MAELLGPTLAKLLHQRTFLIAGGRVQCQECGCAFDNMATAINHPTCFSICLEHAVIVKDGACYKCKEKEWNSTSTTKTS